MMCQQVKDLVVVPTLKLLEGHIPYSESAVKLLLMTIAHESRRGEYLQQVDGPALGIYQMELATAEDIEYNYLKFRPDLQEAVWSFAGGTQTLSEDMATNLMYATAMARVHYYRVKEPLPPAYDVASLAKYAKAHYNTELGKATEHDYWDAYLTWKMERL